MKSPSSPLAGRPVTAKRGFSWLLLFIAGLSATLPAQTVEPSDATATEAVLDTSHGLLWRIESAGGTSSHLFGTIHVAEPAVLQLPSPVRAVFDAADLLVVEVVLEPGDYLKIARRMKLTGGQTLPGLIGESLYSRVLHAAHSRDISQPLRRLRPWAVATLLVTPRSISAMVLDQQLERDAVMMGKPVMALESVDEQLAVFENMSIDDQVDLLHEAVLATLEFEVYYGELLVAYLNRDLARLVHLSRLHLAQRTRLKQTLQVRLVDQRNQRMIERLSPILRQGGAFIAVGALHLPGEAGLLQRLNDQGYRVVREY